MRRVILLSLAICLILTSCGPVGGKDDVSDGCSSTDPSDVMIIVEKPVIYLYPLEDETAVSVSLDFNGEFTDIIPEFTSEHRWDVIADRNGLIELNDVRYDYLYWEGAAAFKYNFFSGFCVKGSETEDFLKNALTTLGLSETEQSDFIEYWIPRMEGNAYNVISFQERNYTKNVRLGVSPEPDSIIRVFMAWYPSDKCVNINAQRLDTPIRKGFTVVEWGGCEMSW